MDISSKRLVRNHGISIHIDEWTNSIIEVSTGRILKTGFALMSIENIKEFILKEWFFQDWRKKINTQDIQVYKMYILEKPEIIQGLLSIFTDKGFIEVRYAENADYKKKMKLYEGVGPNLFAFASIAS